MRRPASGPSSKDSPSPRDAAPMLEENGRWLQLDATLAASFVEAILSRPGIPPTPAPRPSAPHRPYRAGQV